MSEEDEEPDAPMMGCHGGTELPIQSDIIQMRVGIGYYVQEHGLA